MTNEIEIEMLSSLIEENLKTFGYLTPVIFLFGEDDIGIMEMQDQFESDEEANYYKDETSNFISSLVKERSLHKVILISESWNYKFPKGMPIDVVKKLYQSGEYKKVAQVEEVYQITEITANKSKIFSKRFHKNEESGKFSFEKEEVFENCGLGRWKIVQEEMIKNELEKFDFKGFLN